MNKYIEKANKNPVELFKLLLSPLKLCFYQLIYFPIIRFRGFIILYGSIRVKGFNGRAVIARRSKIDNLFISFEDNLSSGSLAIGEGCLFYGDVKLLPRGGNIQIGDNVFLGDNVLLSSYRGGLITIGNGSMIAKDSNIYGSNHDTSSPPDSYRKEIAQPVHIGKNVWIGTQCVILPGVSIGNNSIIAAHSVVNSDIPENVLAAGIPAVPKKKFINGNWVKY